jgi:hypothetical protein
VGDFAIPGKKFYNGEKVVGRSLFSIEEIVSEQGSPPNFRDLSIQLAAYAVRIFAEYGLYREESVISGTGFSMEDFVADILGKYATKKIKYHPSRGTLMSLLGTALKRDVHDAVLRKRSHLREEARDLTATLSERTKGGTNKTLSEFPDHSLAADRLFDDQEYKARILGAVGEEPELKELAEMAFELQIAKRKDQADFLGISPQELDNRKKKLRRRLIEYGITKK